VVIVVVSDKVGGSHLNLIRTLDGHPYFRRPDLEDLHHFLGVRHAKLTIACG